MRRSWSTSSIPTASFKRCSGIAAPRRSARFLAFRRQSDQLCSFLDQIAGGEPHRFDDAIGGRGPRLVLLLLFPRGPPPPPPAPRPPPPPPTPPTTRHLRPEPPRG